VHHDFHQIERIGADYRQVVRSGYRHLPASGHPPAGDELRIYYVAHARRGLPPEDLLRHQSF